MECNFDKSLGTIGVVYPRDIFEDGMDESMGKRWMGMGNKGKRSELNQPKRCHNTESKDDRDKP